MLYPQKFKESDLKNTILLWKTFSFAVILSSLVYAAPGSYVDTSRLIGIQIGHVSGLSFVSKAQGPEFFSGTIGVNGNDLAVQVQLCKVYPFQRVPHLSWYYGLSGDFINRSTPVVEIGVPFGLMYSLSEGPAFFVDLAPTMSLGHEVSVSLQPEFRTTIPF